MNPECFKNDSNNSRIYVSMNISSVYDLCSKHPSFHLYFCLCIFYLFIYQIRYFLVLIKGKKDTERLFYACYHLKVEENDSDFQKQKSICIPQLLFGFQYHWRTVIKNIIEDYLEMWFSDTQSLTTGWSLRRP